MALISVTRLRIRSARFLPPFIWYSVLSLRQARRARGNVKAEVFRAAGNAFWTLTSWRDIESMRAYIKDGAHRRAMPKLLEWCDEAAVVHWEQEGAELPARDEAHRRMVAEGRPSKVNHPSPRHTAHEIPAP